MLLLDVFDSHRVITDSQRPFPHPRVRSVHERHSTTLPLKRRMRTRVTFWRPRLSTAPIHRNFSFAADLSRLRRSRVPNLARAGTLELAKWDNSIAKVQVRHKYAPVSPFDVIYRPLYYKK
jgi:hypothetical protein